MPSPFRRYIPLSSRKVGLALGGGAARGWAHIGVIHALSEAGVHIDYVAGTSIGSLVGAALASGKVKSLEMVVRELDWTRALSLLDMGLPRSGLLDGHHVTAAIREHVTAGDIADLMLPFCAVSTDLFDGSEVLLDSGDVIEAIRASISIPGVFTPVKRDGRMLVDGGLVNPVPTSVAREMGAEYVISVDLNHGRAGLDAGVAAVPSRPAGSSGEEDDPGRYAQSGTSHLRRQLAAVAENLASHHVPGLERARRMLGHEWVPGILDVVISSLTIMEMQITEMRLAQDPPDLLLRPDLGHIRPTEFYRGAEAIAEGRRVTEEALRRMDPRMLR
jgi:NTE family protein